MRTWKSQVDVTTLSLTGKRKSGGPSDDGMTGYRGWWGPRVALDPFTGLGGMRFPEFWRMFFVALTKVAPQEF